MDNDGEQVEDSRQVVVVIVVVVVVMMSFCGWSCSCLRPPFPDFPLLPP